MRNIKLGTLTAIFLTTQLSFTQISYAMTVDEISAKILQEQAGSEGKGKGKGKGKGITTKGLNFDKEAIKQYAKDMAKYFGEKNITEDHLNDIFQKKISLEDLIDYGKDHSGFFSTADINKAIKKLAQESEDESLCEKSLDPGSSNIGSLPFSNFAKGPPLTETKITTNSHLNSNLSLKEALEQLEKYKEQIEEKVPNEFGASLTVFKTPSEVLAFVREFEKFHQALPASHPAKNAQIIQKIYLKAMEILFKGRGQSGKGSGDGWYSAIKHGATGLPELHQLLNSEVLDADGIATMKKIVESFNYEDSKTKISQGFPPAFNISSDSIKENVLIALDALKAKTPKYEAISLYKAPDEHTRPLRELLEEKYQGNIPSFIRSVLDELENNLYDKSVKTLMDPEKKFIDYFGREVEVDQIVQGLARLERAHILLTGKAGVGKTTILQMLQDRFVRGDIKFRNEPSPIILELPITAITNDKDPTEIKNMVNAIKAMAEKLNRHVIIYVDEAHIATKMTKNALKSFLTEKLMNDSNLVHMIWSTTSNEAKTFNDDVAFTRRWTKVHIPEFTTDQSIEAIKKAYLPLWKKVHQYEGLSFKGIDDDAYLFAARHFKLEQPEAGNPTGMKEFIEGALVRKLKKQYEQGKKGTVTVSVDDMREYLMDNTGVDLVPGDPQFNEKFEAKWNRFLDDYKGNEGFKYQIKEQLKSHFSSLDHDKMNAWVVFGAPGGGKTFAAEQIAEKFFGGALLALNGAELKNGGMELNKLLGSPSGTEGSEEQRSVLTRFMADHPRGGIIKIEEADYMHQDVIQLFTNMITDKKFIDGLGKEWDTSRYILVMNSNIGQEEMIPKDTKNRMTWEQYQTRRKNLTTKKKVGDQEIEVVREDKISQIFDKFVETVVTKSHPGDDTAGVAQEANKQKRRYKAFYVLTPNEEELIEAAKSKTKKFVEKMKIDHGVQFEIDDSTIEKLANTTNYDFEKGFSYVQEQLENKIFAPLKLHSSAKGQNLKVQVNETVKKVHGKRAVAQELVVNFPAGKEEVHSLGLDLPPNDNQWAQNDEMRRRIQNFSTEMRKTLKGNVRQIETMKELLKLKLLDWNTRLVMTQIGTSGNGKTEYFKSLAKSLFGNENALFKISGLNHPYDLNNYFRPPSGVINSNKETDFEKWFSSRKNAGGGVILFDELLSFTGIGKEQVSNKIAVINELYDLLDEGKLKLGGKIEDANSFIIGITGNAMQELFAGIEDSPEAEKLVERIKSKITQDDISKYFSGLGMDAPKLARLGKIFVNGPLTRKEATEVGKMKAKKNVRELLTRIGQEDVEVEVDDQVIEDVTQKLTTLSLGMRKVNKGIEEVVLAPVGGILSDLGLEVDDSLKIKAQLSQDKDHINWFVNGKKVALVGTPIDDDNSGLQGGMQGGFQERLEEKQWKFVDEIQGPFHDRTPKLSQLVEPSKIKVDEKDIKITAIHELKGHWMVDVLLHGENPDESISVIPGENYLGYVRPKEKKSAGQNFTSTLKEMIILEAGHRAVFQEGIYQFGGGGSGKRSAHENPMDDLGKVNRLIDALLSNQIFEKYSEFSHKAEQEVFRKVMREIATYASDVVIGIGNQSKQFEPLYQKLIQERFLHQEDLDQYVAGLDWKELGEMADKDKLFLHAIQIAGKKILDPSQEEKPSKKVEALVQEIIQKAKVETEKLKKI